MTFPLPVKVAYCLFCLCVHLFPVGKKVHFFIMIFISLNIFVYLLFSPGIDFVAFSAFRRFLVVYLVPLCVAVCV